MGAKSNGTNGKHPKTATSKLPALIPQPNGKGALLSGGMPGNAGGTGRPPNWLKDFCDELLDKHRDQIGVVLGNADHPAYATMWAKVAERAHGKAPQPVEVSGEVEHLHGVIEVPPKLSPEQWRQRYKQTA